MKTAQEAVGEYGVDTIKRIFDEELNVWEKKRVYDYIESKLLPEEDLQTMLAPYSDYEILETIPSDVIRDYIAETDSFYDLSVDEMIDYIEENYPGELEARGWCRE